MNTESHHQQKYDRWQSTDRQSWFAICLIPVYALSVLGLVELLRHFFLSLAGVD